MLRDPGISRCVSGARYRPRWREACRAHAAKDRRHSSRARNPILRTVALQALEWSCGSHGFADDPEGVARHVARCLATGVAALSIEDSTGDQARPLYELSRAVERIQAARAAVDEAGHGAGDALLVGRAECFLTGHPEPLAESIRRLRAYAAAGADVLYAPGLRTRDQIAAVVAAVAPKPVNVLALPGMRVAELAELGVRRISVGGGLARAAWGGFLRAAREIGEAGTFTALGEAPTGRDLDAFFTADLARRRAER